ncbi:MAG: hypothetical protein IJ471_01400 [Eubacterium sp.]|nr:hypothetical protein [Eubacterium sp.]
MSREILFKAKRLDNGEWVEGDLIHSFDEENRFAISNEFGLYEVAPYTICQYTGLTDKNGKKIWENDILSCGGNLVVTWKENLASFCLSKKGWLYQHFFGEAVETNDVVVIGNIFDNPELLEGGAEHE